MLSESELARIKKRAEHLLALGRKQGQESIIYHVLRGDAIDVLALIEEIQDIKREFARTRRTDFKLITPNEINVLLTQGEGSDSDN